MKILVLNGPNLKLLGTREPEIYGSTTLADIEKSISEKAAEEKIEVEFFQSNCEGALVGAIGNAMGQFDGLIFNPAAYTHTSVALHDALLAVNLPCVEVHLSNVHKREPFRHTSFTASACIGQITGFGPFGYIMALVALKKHIEEKTK